MEKLVPDPLKKTKIKHISGLTVSSFIQFVFSVCPSRGLPTLNLFEKYYKKFFFLNISKNVKPNEIPKGEN